jgi:apolipoprotein N-acyltransferase
MKNSSTNLGEPLKLPFPSKRTSSGWFAWLLSLAASAFGGGLIGLSWHESQVPLIGLAGIFGLALILYTQLKARSIGLAIFSALVAGYVSFCISETWIASTAQSLTESSPVWSAVIGHGVHLWHGGLFVLFAIAYWPLRRSLNNGWMLAPAVWVACESVYPMLYPAKQGSLILDVTCLAQCTSLTGVAGASFQVILIALTIASFILWLEQCFTNNRGHIESAGDRLPAAVSASYLKINAWGWLVLLIPTIANGLFGSIQSRKYSTQTSPSFSFAQGDDLASSQPRLNRIVDEKTLKLTLLQTDTEYATFHLDLMKLSKIHATGSDLLVWPECSVGKYNQQLTDFTSEQNVYENATQMGYRFRPLPDPPCSLLAGGYSWQKLPGQQQIQSMCVSAFLFDVKEQLLGRHDKIELMAGGEYRPIESFSPELANMIFGAVDDLEKPKLRPGTKASPVGSVNQVPIGAMLCCEDMYSDISRELVRNGAQVLICMANGMAFDQEAPLRQHFNIARFRAIENNRYFVRCGSHGVTCLVSPTGQVIGEAPCFETAIANLSIPVAQPRSMTFFSRYGDWLTTTCWVVLAVSFFGCYAKKIA